MMTVIGLAGVKTSGKSTVANIISEFVETNEVALADKLKNVCSEIFYLERKQFDHQDLKEVPFKEGEVRKLGTHHIRKVLEEFGIEMTPEEMGSKYGKLVGMKLETPRKIAQIVGTEILREAGNEDIHCENLVLKEDSINVVSDVRFLNEFYFFKNNNNIKFVPLYIQRDVAENLINKDSHGSETSVFTFSDKCIKIDNNGTLGNTEIQVKNIIDTYIFNTKKEE